ncbi:MAG: carboxypeptidase regulatory-like domain-containing protein [Gemmatimonadales bacterium]|nr:MAG: carboxypeptidase regulatory-like domain-containing protein [Gemmatimonadales bacterium]
MAGWRVQPLSFPGGCDPAEERGPIGEDRRIGLHVDAHGPVSVHGQEDHGPRMAEGEVQQVAAVTRQLRPSFLRDRQGDPGRTQVQFAGQDRAEEPPALQVSLPRCRVAKPGQPIPLPGVEEGRGLGATRRDEGQVDLDGQRGGHGTCRGGIALEAAGAEGRSGEPGMQPATCHLQARSSRRPLPEHSSDPDSMPLPRHAFSGAPGRVPALLVLLLLLVTASAEAQFTDTGTLRVELRDPSGSPVEGARIEVEGENLASILVLRSGSNGDATAGFLPGGIYTLRVERFGLVPLVADGVRVVAGRRSTARLQVRPGEPPVRDTDRVTLPGGVRPPSAPGWAPPAARDRTNSIPGARPGGGGLHGGPPPVTAGQAGYPGFPGQALRLELDDLLQVRAFPGGRESGWDRLLLPPIAGLSHWKQGSGLLSHASTGPGDLIRLTSLRPGAESRGGVRALASHHERTAGEGRPTSSASGGVFEGWMESGLSGDSVRVAAALGVGRSVLSSPAGLGDPGSVPQLGSGSDQPAEDLVGRSWISGSGILAWDTGSRTTLTTRLHMAHLPEQEPVPPVPLARSHAVSRSGTDVGTSFHLLTTGESGSAIELRTDLQRSSRSTAPADGVGLRTSTAVLESGSLAGIQPGDLGEETRTRISLTPAGRLVRGVHLLEGGLALGINRHEDRIGVDSHGLVGPAGVDGAGPVGQRLVSGADPRTADFSWQEVALFSRYSVEVGSGITASMEGRADLANLPTDEVPDPPESWVARTGIALGELDASSPRGSGSVGVRWEPDVVPGLEIRTRMGLHRDGVDPRLVSDLLRGGTRPSTLHVGSLADSGSGTRFDAPDVLLVGPNWERARGRHVEAALSVPLGGNVRLDAGVEQMATRGLSRLRDLNRTPGPGRVDPFGRQIWGEVVEEAGLVTLRPGSDRRFPEFNRVGILESDGEVESTAVSTALSVRTDAFHSTLQYRWSRTEDNQPFGLAGRPALRPGVMGMDGADAATELGRSDLDMPHLLHWSGSLQLPLPGQPVLGWSHSSHSDRPFTAGVRDALDPVAWTEGWQRLEPIRVPGDMDLSGIESTWQSCLSGGGRLQRNGCRGGMVHALDARLGVDLPGPGNARLHLVVEARNLLDQGVTIRDGALLVVEPGAPLRTSTDSTLDLPARLNPDFGAVLADLSPGRSLHIGIEARIP